MERDQTKFDQKLADDTHANVGGIHKVYATKVRASGLLAWPKQCIQAMRLGRDVAAFRDVDSFREKFVVRDAVCKPEN